MIEKEVKSQKPLLVANRLSISQNCSLGKRGPSFLQLNVKLNSKLCTHHLIIAKFREDTIYDSLWTS
uniref:Uncharacterized protein n=1 Tax=Nelumbo nucifera TaxID=4432 RepID=A0A822ZRB8_NELNU|nr:TPA_asm: hypothetical protein HUJ06_004119 [Nelumbo nucifera]